LAEDDQTLDPALAAGLFAAHAEELRRFLWGVLRDATLVQDVLQSTFVKLVEKGSSARDETRKAWLFRVAYNQALAIRRRQAVGNRVLENVGREQDQHADRADEPLVRHENNKSCECGSTNRRRSPKSPRSCRFRWEPPWGECGPQSPNCGIDSKSFEFTAPPGIARHCEEPDAPI
jgi:hypothetical protein